MAILTARDAAACSRRMFADAVGERLAAASGRGGRLLALDLREVAGADEIVFADARDLRGPRSATARPAW